MSGDFLSQMKRASAERAREAQLETSLQELRARTADMPPAPALTLADFGFDVIAEVKRRSPSQGALARAADTATVHREIAERTVCYARGGACAISVLTEPSRFDGCLAHLTVASAAAEALGVPVMRKDFLVDPYQVFEARAAGAGGVLLIVRMLSDARLREMLDAAASVDLFVLIEAFDGDDLARAQALARSSDARILIGLNTRDLTTLEIDPERLARHASDFTRDWPSVAESGVVNVEDACMAKALGYRMALIGTALMQARDPATLLKTMLDAARRVGVHGTAGHA